MIVARHFSAWNALEKDPSRRERCDPYVWLIRRPDRSTLIGPQSYRALRDGSCFSLAFQAKVSGYDHSIPPGQRPTGPSGQSPHTVLMQCLSNPLFVGSSLISEKILEKLSAFVLAD